MASSFSGWVAKSIANASYASWVCVVSLGKSMAAKRLAATRLANDWPQTSRDYLPHHLR